MMNQEYTEYTNQENINNHVDIDLDDLDDLEKLKYTGNLKPRYEEQKDGIYWINVKKDDDGNITETPLKISSPFKLIGLGYDENNTAYRVIEYMPINHKTPKKAVLQMGEIGSMQGWKALQNLTITPFNGKSKRDKLADYLLSGGKTTPYKITHTVGWKDGAYFLPNGEFLENQNQKQKQKQENNYIYNGDLSQIEYYHQKGTLKEWQENIAKYCLGNSRLMLEIGTALASPLLRITGIDNGGFHLFGDSKDGKTTTAKMGLTVWANPESKVSWNATPLALINSAYARNDNFLMLDEISECKPLAVAQSAYSLGNGQSKGQAEKDKHGNRATIRFRTLFFSTGEKPLDVYIKMGDPKLWNAGQAVRLASIPSIPNNQNNQKHNQDLSVLDTTHQFNTSWELLEYLNKAGLNYYGTAGINFIRALQSDSTHQQKIYLYMQDFETELNNCFDKVINGQIRTIAKRFALIYGALELATEYKITGFKQGDSLEPLKQCFLDWLERNGTEKGEDTQIIENALDLIETAGGSIRFQDLDFYLNNQDTGAITDKTHHAGFKHKNKNNQTEFWILSKVFKQEIVNNFELKKAVDVLERVDWLVKGRGQSSEYGSHQKKNIGRVYILMGYAPPEKTESENY